MSGVCRARKWLMPPTNRKGGNGFRVLAAEPCLILQDSGPFIPEGLGILGVKVFTQSLKHRIKNPARAGLSLRNMRNARYTRISAGFVV